LQSGGGVGCGERFEYDAKNDITSMEVKKFPFKATVYRDNETRVITVE